MKNGSDSLGEIVKVGVLGSTGLLGSILIRELSKVGDLYIKEINRKSLSQFPGNQNLNFSLERADWIELKSLVNGLDMIINCIAISKIESQAKDLEVALKVNGIFPLYLSEICFSEGVNLIHISSNGVFSGKTANSRESNLADSGTYYGLSKSIGDLAQADAMVLRTSHIGREINSQKYLMERLISSKSGSEFEVYENHFWNGVTSWHLARIIIGIITKSGHRRGLFHIVPTGVVSRAKLCKDIVNSFGRTDVKIKKIFDENPKYMTLDTDYVQINNGFWADAGYESIPSIPEMLTEYAEEYIRR